MKRVTALCGLAVLTAVLTIGVGCTQQKKSVRLRFKFEPGVVQHHTMDNKRTWETIMNDSVTEQGKSSINVEVEQLTRRMLEDSTAEILQTESWRYDHKSKDVPGQIDTITGSRSVVLYLRPNGRFVDIEFPAEFEFEDTAYLRSLYEQAATVFPDGMVTQGETWSSTTRLALDTEPVEATTRYELRSFVREKGHDCVSIAYDGNLIIPVTPLPGDTTRREGVDHIEITGMMYFAYREGIVVSAQDRWLRNSERRWLKDGEWIEVAHKAETDVDYQLKNIQTVK